MSWRSPAADATQRFYDGEVRDSWDQRIGRAEDLARNEKAPASLLAFYSGVLRIQRDIHRFFGDQRPAGLDRDARALSAAAAPLLRCVAEDGPPLLAEQARALSERGVEAIEPLLHQYWRDRSDRDFFGKAIVQPYAQRLVEDTPGDVESASRRCPRCGGAPQLSIIDTAGSSSNETASRRLFCATCLTPWAFPRVVCAHCGQEDERKVGYFRAAPLEHVRVDACESCLHYIKSIDIGRLGLAVPLVDEVAASALDLWAREHGYEKIELNLLGV